MSLNMFNRAIPGQSLTQEPGASPWEHPPQFANPADALEYLFETLSQPRNALQLIMVLKKGMPVEWLAKTIIMDGFTKNKWTPDVGMLILKTLMRIIISIAVLKGVKPKIFNPDAEMDKFLDNIMDVPDDASTIMPKASQEDELPEFTGLLGAKTDGLS